MNNDYFKKNIDALEYAITLAPVMKTLAEPLLSNTRINNFSYLKFYSDGSVMNLTTDINWIKYRFTENIKYKILFESDLNNICLNKPYLYLWPNNIDDKLLGALHYYGIWNGCNIYIPSKDQIEVFSFASDVKDYDMSSFYANNVNLLNKFIIYFMCHKERVLKENIVRKITTDITFPALTLSKQNSTKNESSLKLAKEIPKIKVEKNIYFTYKEAECCWNLMQGFSFKSIGNKLGISSRTVETHINNAKDKINSCTKEFLIDYLNDKRWIFDSLFMEN